MEVACISPGGRLPPALQPPAVALGLLCCVTKDPAWLFGTGRGAEARLSPAQGKLLRRLPSVQEKRARLKDGEAPKAPPSSRQRSLQSPFLPGAEAGSWTHWDLFLPGSPEHKDQAPLAFPCWAPLGFWMHFNTTGLSCPSSLGSHVGDEIPRR